MTELGQPSNDGDVAIIGDGVAPVLTGAEAVDAPAVVAVVVACNPGPYLNETLVSLSNQDYSNLSVLVVDAGSREPIADRVAEVLPEAYLHRLAGDPGFSVAANQAIELVSGSPFLLFCHDDVALAPDCVTELMSELYRSNAGIAGPKLVQWADPRRLLQLGMGSDRFGVMVEQVEEGEFDQDQYDAVRDVFVVPGAVQLIRADLFAALGGFDAAIKTTGEDLDLCWRAQIAGARVIVVPSAKARHRESMDDRITVAERRRLLTRHRLRTVLATAGRGSIFTVILAFFLILIESIYSILAGRRGQAKDVLAAIPWNLSRLDDLRRKRRQIRKSRSVSNGDVARRQVAGSARLAAFSRGQFSAGQDRFSLMLGSVRSSFRGEDSGNVRDATVIIGLLSVLFLFGSRHLITRGVVPVGEFPDVPGGFALLNEFFSGWRSAGVGGPGNPPTALFFLGLGRVLFGWAPGFFDTALIIGPLFLGPVGVYRLARPLASPRAGAVGALFYACNPIAVSALSSARWHALVLYAAAPYLLGALLRVLGVAPYGSVGGQPGLAVADRHLPARLLRFAFLVAVVAAFAPAVIPIAVVMALVVGGIMFVVAPSADPRPMLLAAVLAVVGPVALHGPWSFDLLPDLSWSWIVGTASPEAEVESLMDLLLFAPGGVAGRYLTLATLIAAAGSLLLARRAMFSLAASGWALAVVFFGLLWVERRGWMPIALPNAETMLTIACVGLALAITAGVRSVELVHMASERLPRSYRLGSAVGVACACLMGLVGLLSTLSGLWETPTQSFALSTERLVERQLEDNPSASIGRVLWIGDPSVVPLDVATSPGGVNYAISDGGTAEVTGRWQSGPVGPTDGVGDALDLAVEGEVVRLGRLLAPYGIDNIVVVSQLAPAPYVGPSVDPGAGVVDSLSQQLDLQRIAGVLSLVVFRNTSSHGVASVIPSADAMTASTPSQQLQVALSDGAQAVQEGPGKWTVSVPADENVLLAVARSDMDVSGARSELVSGFDGLAVVPRGPEGELLVEYRRRLPRRLAVLGQAVLVLTGIILAQTRREVRR